ncbi:MAG: hypothetical protein LBP62_07110 [Clostridiales bacterium]|jgi:beta-galactosidase/beta-glucuronidase|nr:hypothetical protein [Clostridiales bacterium]
MKYQIDKTNYKTFEIFEKNRLAPRAYFIPFSSAEELENTDFMTERYQSKRVNLLSGDWKFKYFERVSLIPDVFDTDAESFDGIKVPSCWQRTGYEPPVYLNVRYPFETNPPHFPEDCPAGVYVKKFDVKSIENKNYILTFLGAAACADVYINGKFVGYGEGGHNGAEFKIDGYIAEGENELLAVVYKWCNGTYLECQDMFRENGIFRDVYITEYNEIFIGDYFADTDKNADGTYDLTLTVKLFGAEKGGKDGENTESLNAVSIEKAENPDTGNVNSESIEKAETADAENTGTAENTEKNETVSIEKTEKNNDGNAVIQNVNLKERAKAPSFADFILKAELKYKGGVIAAERAETADANPSLSLKKLAVKEWSAEIPEIYELIITLEKRGNDGEKGEIYDVIRNYTGFKTIEIDGNVFKLNGKKIKIKGVNHHDSTPSGGYVMTAEELKKDVLLMKEYNVNGVRTSHYPKDPVFVTLCDVYGLYVIDEADIETHGCFDQKKWNIFNRQPGMNRISDDPKWEKHYTDRVKRLYYKDRNHPSVIMWSLGNEAGGIANQDACYKLLKSEGAKAPVHYEGARHTKRKYYDVRSTMYPFMSHVSRVVKGTALPGYQKVPYFFCEYAHAMGFGPGNLREYVEAFYSSDILMGGCIWEFADHAVLHETGECQTGKNPKETENGKSQNGKSQSGVETAENEIQNKESRTENENGKSQSGISKKEFKTAIPLREGNFSGGVISGITETENEKFQTETEKTEAQNEIGAVKSQAGNDGANAGNSGNANKYKYTYGGDHGEKIHDGNFCVDGLFYPDRTPHTGALNMKAVYRPVRASLSEAGVYAFENTNRFLPSGYIEIEWKLLKNGIKAESGSIDADIPPESVQKIAVPHRKIDKSGEYHINFLYRDRRDGHIIAEEQIELQTVPSVFKSEETSYKAEIVDGAAALTVKFKGGSAEFDKTAGRMTSLKYKEKEYLNRNPEGGITGFYPSVYRAPLDNDNMIRVLYKKFGIDGLSPRLKKFSASLVGENGEKIKKKSKTEAKKAEIKILYSLEGKYKLFNVSVVYVIDGKGKITVTARLTVAALLCKVYKRMLPIPRFGLEVEIDGKYDNAEYFGTGGGETLPDMTDHAAVGIYSKKVSELRERYIKPQDSGNRSGVRYLKIFDAKGNGLIFKKSGENFNFAANRFTTKQLAEAKHQEDLIEKNTVNLRIDGFVRGTGSNSCGPLPLKKYTIDMNRPLIFSFSIEPINR